MILTGCGRELDLSQPRIMGILNITPDSFSDGSRFNQLDRALFHAEKMIAEGAAIIDVGGESTRPGAVYVSEQEELDRVVPVIEQLSQKLDVMISIDTYKPAVMAAACQVGAHLINDIKALQEPDALRVAVQSQALICLMHMQGEPQSMQHRPVYKNVVDEVSHFLNNRVATCLAAGIAAEKLILDPGFGFGKTLEQNYELLGRLNEMQSTYPLLIGVSRKSMIGNLLNRSVDERLAGSIAAALYALAQGARIIRVHDVQATCDAVNVFWHAQQYQTSHIN
ncbi:dihydropteroate synthase [uncultured Tolumonas sp.]|uniref:dihydropteroate synthase n=1 Tax=uncultured Tolumonas sp. TaxID=263765 RepID=UPI002A0A1BDB|nr:dihydropteroate synthase [uncultured Tolumonas sp.]